MLTAVIILNIIALCFLFLLASIWSEDNVRFGYVLVPLIAAFFWWAGFLPFAYLTTIIPLLIFMGVITFFRSQLRVKFGVFGSSGGILFKIIFFLIIIQMAIGYVNGMGLFADQMAMTPQNEYTTYTLANANESFSGVSSGLPVISDVVSAFQLGLTMFRMLWGMVAAVFLIYPILVDTFGMPSSLSLVIQCGIYVIYAVEIFNILYTKSRIVEV